MRNLILIISLFVLEREHSANIAVERKGIAEFRTPDGSRVDVLTEEYAIEVEWSSKWAEAIGQSLYYGIATNRKPAIILLVKDPIKERKYYLRCLAVCAKHNIYLETKRVND